MKNLEKIFGTQKQWLCVVALVLICAGTAFAQARSPAPAAPAPTPARPSPAPTPAPAASAQASSAKKTALSLDLMPLVKGILASNEDLELLFIPISVAFEHRVASHMSIGAIADVYFGKVGEDPRDGDDIPYFYFGIGAAWRYSPMSDGIEKLFVGAILGFNVQTIDGKTKEEDGGFAGPVIGVNFGYKALLGKTFFIEPSMSYFLEKNNGGPNPLGWTGGLRIGVAF